jgi:Fe-S cluster biogenesis protein NfuA/nitrite reductase/ring-hydroxylating ferredoxin subunit
VDDLEARELVARVEQLLDDVEAITDPAAREAATEMAGVLLDLYGEGIARRAALVPDPGALAQDELVSHLLLLHGIHPVPVEDRVRTALEEVRPYLDSHGGGVELLEVVDGTVRLRMRGSCSGCPSSAVTLKLAIEEAIRKHAPDVDEIEAQDAAPAPALIELAPPVPAATNGNGWQTAGSLPQLRADGTVLKDLAGEPVLFIRVDGTFYAYRPVCAGCGHSLADAELQESRLRCAGCGRSFSVARAGRCLDDPGLSLNPLPLLEDDAGLVKVAIG